MAAVYTSAANVRSLLQVDSASTAPSTAEIDAFINRAEDYIDRQTGHAWRSVTVANEYKDLLGQAAWDAYAGQPIYLSHRDIISIDKLEIWNGSSYEDWVVTKVNDRNKDYWFDAGAGILFLRSTLSYGRARARVSYKYGNTVVPKDIEEAATKLAAIDMASADDRVALIPKTGSPQINLNDKVAQWNKRIAQIIEARKEIRVVVS